MMFAYKPKTKLNSVNTLGNIEEYEQFNRGDHVYYRSHLKDHLNWIPCTIDKQHSKYLYVIGLGGSIRTVHVSTLRKRIPRFVNIGETKEKDFGVPTNTEVDIEPRRSKRILEKQLLK